MDQLPNAMFATLRTLLDELIQLGERRAGRVVCQLLRQVRCQRLSWRTHRLSCKLARGKAAFTEAGVTARAYLSVETARNKLAGIPASNPGPAQYFPHTIMREYSCSALHPSEGCSDIALSVDGVCVDREETLVFSGAHRRPGSAVCRRRRC